MFHENHDGGCVYLTADALSGSRHCFSTRLGGVSGGALCSLNLGVGRGDALENVIKNYEILGNCVGFRPEDTVFTKQVHTDTVCVVTKRDCGTGLFRPQQTPCDALICNEPGVALCAFTADCVPILLFDPVKKAVGAVHAGWRGTALGIVKKTVLSMRQAFGCSPDDICAAIGPHIGPCHFLTDEDVPNAMKNALGEAAERAVSVRGEKYAVDLGLLNRIWLEQAGVRQIDESNCCTACDPERFWSHRIVGQSRGAMAAVIMLEGL